MIVKPETVINGIARFFRRLASTYFISAVKRLDSKLARITEAERRKEEVSCDNLVTILAGNRP